MAPHALVLDLGPGQGLTQVGELLLAFALSAVVGLERELRGKSAGLRTQTIVGTASALILLVGKYGFSDVLGAHVRLDPSRVGAQIVSGIGFLGAGLIITRHGAIHGLTTAAAVWETAAIGMAAGAGLPVLAVIVTALHFVVTFGFTGLIAVLPGRLRGAVRVHIVYEHGAGVLRDILAVCSEHRWSVQEMSVDPDQRANELARLADPRAPGLVGVAFTLLGPEAQRAPHELAGLDGVVSIARADEERE
ncbi:MAG TPA: MgtC/SapB family protein [Marmoricola sp.]|nr:MgtC/SapB family protein [Marmoricola sp.]